MKSKRYFGSAFIFISILLLGILISYLVITNALEHGDGAINKYSSNTTTEIIDN